jgi:dTDP-glucose 4,6-dehydratase
MTILVTGAAGFIGTNFVLNWINNTNEDVIAIDKLTYASSKNSLSGIVPSDHYKFFLGDINNGELLNSILDTYKPNSIINFAAETHVDKSIDNPDSFIDANVLGTYSLLKSTYNYWKTLTSKRKSKFRFLHISTDEVFGALKKNDKPFTESHPYKPNNPYAASKASSDHFVRAFFHTYALPTIVTNCSNNYGPYQHPEKLIPLIITNALNGKSLPIYGDGNHIRDWLFVSDHIDALFLILNRGTIGESYNIGGSFEKKTLEVVQTITTILDTLKPLPNKKLYCQKIKYIKDRPGHDFRYAIDSSKLVDQLGWKPKELFETGIYKTVLWYLNNPRWIDELGRINFPELPRKI